MHHQFQPRIVNRGSIWLRGAVSVLLLTLMILAMGASRGVQAQTGSCSNVLANGGFETSTGWQTQSNGTYTILSNYQAHSGVQSAYLAGVNGANDHVSTTLTLPKAQSITFSFWWLVETQETSTGNDGLAVLVADSAGNPLKSLATMSDADANVTGAWQQLSVDLTEFAGQTVQLQFAAQTDGSLSTDFYVDDAAVTACAASVNVPHFSIFLPSTQR